MTDPFQHHGPVSTAARGRCPRCASGRLFDGFLRVADECEACGLDLRFEDAGDGAVVPVILVVGFVVVGLALYAEAAHDASLLFHFTIWPTLVVALALPLMRVVKGALVGQQYRVAAGPTRADPTEPGE